MKLDSKMRTMLDDINYVAKLMQIDEISIEHNEYGTMVRGYSVLHGAPTILSHIISEDEILPFRAMAIMNCVSFLNKSDIADSQDSDYIIDVEVDSGTQFVKTITFKGKKFKLTFAAGLPSKVRSPKLINDTEKFYFQLDEGVAETLTKGIRAMEADAVTLVSDGDRVFFEIGKSQTDRLEFTVSEQVKTYGEEDAIIASSYPFKTFIPILRNCDDGIINVTTRGCLMCYIRGIRVYIFPQKKGA